MLNIDLSTLIDVLDYPAVIKSLQQIFISDFEMPLRHHHFYRCKEGSENTLILMPSWTNDFLGIKQVVVAPDNPGKNLPTIHAQYTLLNAVTGEVLAMMNAAYLTSVRTACTSALAAGYLATQNAETLLVVGTGKVAYHLVQAHAKTRKYKRIIIWGRNVEKARIMADKLLSRGYKTEISVSLEAAVMLADVISCATMSAEPLIKGEWLKPGQHLDLVGAYKPQMREVDDQAIIRSCLFVDSRLGALHESGELSIPLKNKLIKPESVLADIVELCSRKHPGRQSDQEITLFKSMGMAIEDLATAILAYSRVKGKLNAD